MKMKILNYQVDSKEWLKKNLKITKRKKLKELVSRKRKKLKEENAIIKKEESNEELIKLIKIKSETSD